MFRRLRQSVFSHLGIKATSLILALAVYLHVYSGQDRTTVLNLPVRLEGLPPTLTWRGEIPREIRVRFRGKGRELFKLRADPPSAVVHLSQPRVGLLERPVTTADVALAPEIDAVAEALIEPVVLSLSIESRRSVCLPVAPRFRGAPPEGFMRYGVARAWPETLTVSGPAGLVTPLDSIRTEEIDLSGRSESSGESVRLLQPDGIQMRIDRVSVRIPIVPVMHQDFGPLRVGLPPEIRRSWSVEPESAVVRLSGPKSLIETLGGSLVRTLAVPSLPVGEDDVVPVQVILPSALRGYLSIERITPSSVVLVRQK
jgi:hypothetical protein